MTYKCLITYKSSLMMHACVTPGTTGENQTVLPGEDQWLPVLQNIVSQKSRRSCEYVLQYNSCSVKSNPDRLSGFRQVVLHPPVWVSA